MLVDDLNEQLARGRDHLYRDGTSHFSVLRGFRDRILSPALYEFDRDAVAMCAHVGLGKPSSVVAALSVLRLPAASVWVEWAGADLKVAMAAEGSPNVKPPGSDAVLERAGFLVWQEGRHLRFEYLSRNRKGDMRAVDAAPVIGAFSLDPVAGGMAVDASNDIRLATGRVRAHAAMASGDGPEGAAFRDLAGRMSFEPHPDFADVLRAAGSEGMDVGKVIDLQAWEARRLFDIVVVPALLLLNCRNAVAVEREPAPERLNRARAKAGKPAILDRHVVRLSLTTRQAARARAAGDGGRGLRAALVIGHFKVRRTGVFWWTPHARAGWGVPAQVVRKVMA